MKLKLLIISVIFMMSFVSCSKDIETSTELNVEVGCSVDGSLCEDGAGVECNSSIVKDNIVGTKCLFVYCFTCKKDMCSQHYCGYSLICNDCGDEFTCPHLREWQFHAPCRSSGTHVKPINPPVDPPIPPVDICENCNSVHNGSDSDCGFCKGCDKVHKEGEFCSSLGL